MNGEQNGSARCDILTIGHSNHPLTRFTDLLRKAGVTAVVDVRTVPSSGRYPWFKKDTLSRWLKTHNIAYRTAGHALGGRPSDPKFYCDGVADYEAMAKAPTFRIGLEKVVGEAKSARVCLMCAEREPLDCHRCLLVSRALAEHGLKVGHILADGTVEPHRQTEERLLTLTAEPGLFSVNMAEWMAAAYRSRARAVAHKAE